MMHKAVKVCRLCPVQAECLHLALANDERFGIWGGVTARGRRRLARSAALLGVAAALVLGVGLATAPTGPGGGVGMPAGLVAPR